MTNLDAVAVAVHAQLVAARYSPSLHHRLQVRYVFQVLVHVGRQYLDNL